MLAFLVTILTSHAFAADLHVKLDGIKNNVGHVEISVFSDNGAFYKDVDHAAAHLRLTAAEAHQFVVTGLAPGDYAIAVFHDENDDGKLNTALGIPKEGYSFSNSTGIMPPNWEKAKFPVGQAGGSITMKMRYL